MQKNKKQPISASFCLPAELKEELRELAEAQGRSISKTIVLLVKNAIEEYKNTK